jgi:hypothetical protein
MPATTGKLFTLSSLSSCISLMSAPIHKAVIKENCAKENKANPMGSIFDQIFSSAIGINMEGMIVTSAMVNAFSPFMLLNCIPNILNCI